MIDVKKTITSSIKYYLMKLMKLGDNNLKVFKKIIYLIILDDIYEWSAYLDKPQPMMKKLKEMRINFIISNPEFIIEKNLLAFKNAFGETYVIKNLQPYVNVNTPQNNDTYKRIWDMPSNDLTIINESINPELKSEQSWVIDPNCNIKIVYYQNINDPDQGKTLNGEPNNINIANLTTCEKMDVYINRETNEVYILDTDGRWKLISNQGLTADQVKDIINNNRQGIIKQISEFNLTYALTDPNGSTDSASVSIATDKDMEDLL